VYEIQLNADKTVKLKEFSTKFKGANSSTTIYASEANMPDDILTKLSALKMVTPPDGYEDIGQRVDDTTFWIYD
jgi:hypothetical protein